MASDLQNLIAIRSNYIATLAQESAVQLAGGPKPTYTIDGINYLWNEYRDLLLGKIKQLSQMIQLEQSPFMKMSRMSPGG